MAYSLIISHKKTVAFCWIRKQPFFLFKYHYLILFCHADDSGAAQTRIFAEHSVNTTFVFHSQLILVYTIFIYQYCIQLLLSACSGVR